MYKLENLSYGDYDTWFCECGTYTPVKKGSSKPKCEYCRRLKVTKR